MKRLKTLIVLLSIGLSVFAQQQGANISFDTDKHDFSTIQESGGPVSYKFEFTNTGNQPLIVQNVSTSCGCTTPNYSKAPVMPGARGFVEVKYDPKNRPGAFTKSITVTSNSIEPTSRLIITGEVAPKPKGIEDEFRYLMGDIRLERRNIYIPQIGPGEIKTADVRVVNVAEKPVTPQFKGIPGHMKVEVEPKTLEPMQEGVIKVVYDASKISAWGSKTDWVVFSTDGQMFNNRLAVSVNIQEDFSKLSPEQLEKAPALSFDQEEYNFGTIEQGAVVEHDFILTNNGKSNLIIRDISASCGCTAAKPSKMVVTPGESVKIEARFDSRGRNGNQTKTVTVITNDPKNSKKLLWIKGVVQTN